MTESLEVWRHGKKIASGMPLGSLIDFGHIRADDIRSDAIVIDPSHDGGIVLPLRDYLLRFYKRDATLNGVRAQAQALLDSIEALEELYSASH